MNTHSKSPSKSSKAAVIFALGGLVGGCDPGASRNSEDQEPDRVALATAGTVIGIISGVLSGASAIKNLASGGDGGTPIADLTNDAIQEIKGVVLDATATWGYEQYHNRLETLLGNVGIYNSPTCNLGQDEGCVGVFQSASDRMVELADEANGIWESFSSEGEIHAANRMHGAFGMISVAGIRTSLLVERARVDAKRGLGSAASWENACQEAGKYHERLKRLDGEELPAYVESRFSPVFTMVTSSTLPPLGGSYSWHVSNCFDHPAGEGYAEADTYCSEEFDVACGDWNQEWCMSWEEDEAGRIIFPENEQGPQFEDVKDQRDSLTAEFREYVRNGVFGGAQFDALMGELDHISTCPKELLSCDQAAEAGPLLNNDEAQEKCPGVCDDVGGDFTNEWWTTVANEQSVCQCRVC